MDSVPELGLGGDEGKQEGKSFRPLHPPPQPLSRVCLSLVLKTILTWETSAPTDRHNCLADQDRQKAAWWGKTEDQTSRQAAASQSGAALGLCRCGWVASCMRRAPRREVLLVW